jgi:hypothetical protein
MTVIKWLGTTAVALAIGTGAVVAQSQREMPQRGEDGPRAQTPSLPSKDADRPAAGEQRPADRQKDRAAQPEPKAGAKEPQRAEDKSAPERKQAQEPAQTRDSKQPAKQITQDQPGRGERPPARATQQRQDEQKGREAKQPADQKQQQTRDEQQKQDKRAVDTKRPADTKQQQGQQQPAPDRTGQAAQPSGARPGDTAQDRQRDPSAGQATDQATRRGGAASATVNDEQRTQIIERLQRDRTARDQNINVQVNIGERLPPRVRPRVLPPDIVRIVPQYRGYEYTVIEDEIVIVEPRSREVVDVIREGGPARATARAGRERVLISHEHRETLKQAARSATTGSTSPSGAAPDANCLTLQPVPEELVRANPDLGSYRYLAIGEQVVLIDPREQKVVEVVD